MKEIVITVVGNASRDDLKNRIESKLRLESLGAFSVESPCTSDTGLSWLDPNVFVVIFEHLKEVAEVLQAVNAVVKTIEVFQKQRSVPVSVSVEGREITIPVGCCTDEQRNELIASLSPKKL